MCGEETEVESKRCVKGVSGSSPSTCDGTPSIVLVSYFIGVKRHGFVSFNRAPTLAAKRFGVRESDDDDETDGDCWRRAGKEEESRCCSLGTSLPNSASSSTRSSVIDIGGHCSRSRALDIDAADRDCSKSAVESSSSRE